MSIRLYNRLCFKQTAHQKNWGNTHGSLVQVQEYSGKHLLWFENKYKQRQRSKVFFLMPLHQLMRAADLENHMTPDTFAAFRRCSSWGLDNRGEPLSRVEPWRRRDNLFRIMFRMRSFTRFTRGGDYFQQHSGLDDFTRVGYCQVLHPKINYLQQSTSEMTANPENIPNDPHLFPYFETYLRSFWCPASFLGFSSLVPGTWSRCQRCMYKYKWIQIASRFDVSVLCFFFWRLLLSTFFTQISVLCTWIGKHACYFCV